MISAENDSKELERESRSSVKERLNQLLHQESKQSLLESEAEYMQGLESSRDALFEALNQSKNTNPNLEANVISILKELPTTLLKKNSFGNLTEFNQSKQVNHTTQIGDMKNYGRDSCTQTSFTNLFPSEQIGQTTTLSNPLKSNLNLNIQKESNQDPLQQTTPNTLTHQAIESLKQERQQLIQQLVDSRDSLIREYLELLSMPPCDKDKGLKRGDFLTMILINLIDLKFISQSLHEMTHELDTVTYNLYKSI